jgi:hypothetical protein
MNCYENNDSFREKFHISPKIFGENNNHRTSVRSIFQTVRTFLRNCISGKKEILRNIRLVFTFRKKGKMVFGLLKPMTDARRAIDFATLQVC